MKSLSLAISLPPYQISQYIVGREFTWLNFASSSVVKKTALQFSAGNFIPVTFKIDNRPGNKWSPRYINFHSFYPDENECLYPFGTRFFVTKRNGNDIELKLSNYHY